MVKLNFSRIKRTLPKVVIIDLCGTILDSLDIDRQVMNEISYTYAGVSYTQLRKKKDRFKSMRHNFSIFFWRDGEYSSQRLSKEIERQYSIY